MRRNLLTRFSDDLVGQVVSFEGLDDNVSISRDQAIAYIESYYKRNGDTYYYTLTVSSLK